MKTNRPHAFCLLTATTLIWGCGGDPIVGKDRCFGEHISCNSDAPTLREPDLFEPLQHTFEVVSSGALEKSWTHRLDADRYVMQVQPAPDGGVWTLLGGGEIKRELRQLDADGAVLASHLVPFLPVPDLTVDAKLQPSVTGWNPEGATYAALTGSGELHAQTIATHIHWGGEGRALVSSAFDAGATLALFTPDESYVARYAADGQLTWQQTDVRDARKYPFADAIRGPEANYALVPLSDGAVAVGVPKYITESTGVTVGRAQGITVLEPDGNVRWDIWFPSAPPSAMLIQPGADGSLLAAYTGSLEGTHASTIVALNRDGEVVASWTALQGEYSAVPAALCSDATGDVYATFLTTEHDRSPIAICRMRSSAPDEAVACRVLEGFEGWPWVMLGGVAAPEPGAIVLAYSTASPEPDFPEVAEIVRVAW